MLIVREHINKVLENYTNDNCTVMLSSGIDSHSVLFSCFDVGIKPTITSFTLDDRESRDFKSAKYTAEFYGLDFIPIYLSTDMDVIKQYLIDIVKTGIDSKTSFECIYPFKSTFDRLETDVILSGYATDMYFALTKRGAIYYQNDVSSYALEKLEGYNKPNSQSKILTKYAQSLGMKYVIPYLTDDIMVQFRNHIYTYKELNKPKQKNPIREQYPELSNCKVYNHTNYQLGDSGISKLFSNLVNDLEWNTKNYKSVVGIYNSLIRGEIPQTNDKEFIK